MVGESNRFAVAAAQAVAKTPGRAWNPLFLHGDSGLGKTHLLHAIANAIHENTPGARVAIVTSERYTNDFVDALSRNTMADFRRKYRECGALLVDDVQFFAGRDKTAEEFFHTFNTLYEQNVQIVLSSDRSPKELKGLEERLCSRFEWGMRVHIDTPEFETRAAILKKKALAERIDLVDEVAALLATHIKSNVRELEGALMRLAAFASLKGEPISVPLARDVLSDVIPPPGYRPSIERIQEAVAAHYGITVARLTSSSREQKIALPRQVAMFLCRELAKETLQTIAEKFNKKDHTTVISAIERVNELVPLRPGGPPGRRHPPVGRHLVGERARGSAVDRPWIGRGQGVDERPLPIAPFPPRPAGSMIQGVLQIGFPSPSAVATHFSTSIASLRSRRI